MSASGCFYRVSVCSSDANRASTHIFHIYVTPMKRWSVRHRWRYRLPPLPSSSLSFSLILRFHLLLLIVRYANSAIKATPTQVACTYFQRNASAANSSIDPIENEFISWTRRREQIRQIQYQQFAHTHISIETTDRKSVYIIFIHTCRIGEFHPIWNV